MSEIIGSIFLFGFSMAFLLLHQSLFTILLMSAYDSL